MRTTLVGNTAAGALLLAGSLALALAVPLGASAHVTIDVNQAAPGSFATLQFQVPNESPTATTTSVTVTLPSDTPFASVRYIPVAGWTTQLVTTTLPAPVKIGEGTITQAVTQVVWTASAGSELGDGSLQKFPLILGPVPDTGSIVLPVDQGLSDGTTVSWSDTSEGAEHPAPVLFVNDPVVVEHDDDGDGDGASPPVVTTHHGDAAPSIGSQPDVLARVLGIVGIVVGAAGLAFGATSRRRTSRGA
jgi:uncharacterized protein YcnI